MALWSTRSEGKRGCERRKAVESESGGKLATAAEGREKARGRRRKRSTRSRREREERREDEVRPGRVMTILVDRDVGSLFSQRALR